MTEETKSAQSEEEWETVECQLWKPEAEGDEIRGIYKEKTRGQYGKDVYYLECDDGVYDVFSTTILEQKMRGCNPGDEIKIRYDGETETQSGRTMKGFTVFRKKRKSPYKGADTSLPF